MIKLICKKCGQAVEFKDHKQAWSDGWDFDKGECSTKDCKPQILPIVKEFQDSFKDEEK
jgi:hypothetical protein